MDKTNQRKGTAKKKAKEMKDNTFKAHNRGEEGGEFSAAWEAEGPGEKRHGSEEGDIFKKKRTADCIEHR